MTWRVDLRRLRRRPPIIHRLAVLAWLVMAGTGHAQDFRPRELGAAFLLNFVRFTVWPDGSFESSDTPVVVTVIGTDPIAMDLSMLSAQERFGQERRAVLVQSRTGINRSARRLGPRDRAVTAEDLRNSHMIFVGREEARHAEWILAQVEGRPVLTVGDDPGFARAGGMLALVARGGRMTFDANTSEIARSGLSVSSKVLRLAQIVESGE